MRDERGSATVLALAGMSVLAFGGFFGLAVAQQALARQQLATAADLTALAAAQSLGEPCVSAQAVANVHEVRLISCSMVGADWRVEVGGQPGIMTQRLLRFAGHEPREITEVATAGF
jgi:secretion/DNA translocation related TadE-like protein